ncbi:ATP-binding protein [Capnocytophaga bilenii]|uniref:ATP-binding protein n=1 Tax=Capnocytophaga bilenii TaxID=2819369 RepID=UPI0028D4494E|nr:ATP-binding protein [Capnocytophaga bilenii]
MLTKFQVSNFKSFGECFEIDFTKVNTYEFNQECIKDNCINNAIVYGKNGVGKSNLGFALFDIIGHLTDKEKGEKDYQNYINLYSKKSYVEFCYYFKFQAKEVLYKYRKKDYKTILYEEFRVDGELFAFIDREKGGNAIVKFKGAENLKTNLETNTEISLLKYIKNNTVLEGNVVNSVFDDFVRFVDEMLFFRSLQGNQYIGFEKKEGGIIEEIIRRDNVSDFQSFLNRAGIECELEVVKSFNQQVLVLVFGDKKVPFWNIVSTGTSSLALFYAWFQDIREKGRVSFLYIDEFDAFYHFELSKLIVEELKKTRVQFVLTTHNTSIMTNDLLRPDCYFIMNKERIVSLAEATDKELREAHNLEKIYKSNGFSI